MRPAGKIALRTLFRLQRGNEFTKFDILARGQK